MHVLKSKFMLCTIGIFCSKLASSYKWLRSKLLRTFDRPRFWFYEKLLIIHIPFEMIFYRREQKKTKMWRIINSTSGYKMCAHKKYYTRLLVMQKRNCLRKLPFAEFQSFFNGKTTDFKSTVRKLVHLAHKRKCTETTCSRSLSFFAVVFFKKPDLFEKYAKICK